MNKLGVDGCELQRDWIVSQLEANAAKWSWLETLKIAASNTLNPLALAIAFRGNIYHALLDEAIKWSWLETLKIAASNTLNPLALAIAFRGNIYHALLDEAISRAKAREYKGI